MKIAQVYVQNQLAGELIEMDERTYIFRYLDDYQSAPVSLTMPITQKEYHFDSFPPFFEGLLPEGLQLESLLRREKIDQKDYFAQLLQVGADLVGDVTVQAAGGQGS
ncbi:MAG: HipA N-terminal domain-containing protein [Bdellovibrionota bacterium]